MKNINILSIDEIKNYYRQKVRFYFKCEKCGCDTSKSKENLLKANSLICSRCQRNQSYIDIYGSKENYLKHRKQKYKENTGYENAGQMPDHANKINTKLIDKHGSLQKAYLIRNEKSKKTCLKKYGVENAFSSGSKFIDKKNNTIKEKYGVENIFQLSETKEKIKKTCLEKYGVDNPQKSLIIKEKVKQTNVIKYGVVCPLQDEEIKQKSKKTMLEKYGVEFGWQLPRYGFYEYKSIAFDSSWELAFWIYHEDNNIKIERNYKGFEYILNNKNRIFYPDFLINNIRLIEIKGDYLKEGIFEEIFLEKKKICEKNNIEILSFNEIKFYLEYIKNKYGLNHLKQFKLKRKNK